MRYSLAERNRNVPVQDVHVGLDFGGAKSGAGLTLGTYIAVKIPNAIQRSWRWYAECPVVLDFEGNRVEICHQKFDDLSITWNTINCSAPIAGWDEADFTPAWRAGHDLLGGFVGAVVREVALLEWRADRDIGNGMVAVEFVFDTGRFAIANALDENVIELGTRAPEYKRHVVLPDDW